MNDTNIVVARTEKKPSEMDFDNIKTNRFEKKMTTSFWERIGLTGREISNTFIYW